MSSNAGNAEMKNRQNAESRTEDAQSQGEIRVNDKRRFTADGEQVSGASPAVEDPETVAESVLETEIEQLNLRLQEAEEKKAEAEKQVHDFAERFRQAQVQLRTETEEQRARMQRTFEQRLESSRGDLIAGLLDTLDNLKRAVTAAEKSENRSVDFQSMLEGVRATALMFESKMKNLGLNAVPGVGEEFNPEIHEAVEIVPVSSDQDNKVIEEFQTGYKFGDKLLRPARVRVGRA